MFIIEKQDNLLQDPVELGEKGYYKVDIDNLVRRVYLDLYEKGKLKSFYAKFSKEAVVNALKNPEKNEDFLRALSNYLYIVSMSYRRMVNYFAHMLTFDYYLEPHKQDFNANDFDVEKFKKEYNKTAFRLENMNLKHEMQKVTEVVFREGIFFGYVHEYDDSFFIQKLNPDYCRIHSIEDGVYTIAFDFSYFYKYPEYLDLYPPEFKSRYEQIKEETKRNKKDSKGVLYLGADNKKWRELNSTSTFCVKMDETIWVTFPPFASMFPLIYDIEDARQLEKASFELDNYKILIGTIPQNDSSPHANDFKLSLNLATRYAERINHDLPDGMGFLLSPFKEIDSVNLHNNQMDRSITKNTEEGFWRNAGINIDLIGGNSPTDAVAEKATIVDEMEVFFLLRQYERNINKMLKLEEIKKYKFRVKFLDITHINKKQVIDQLRQSATYGIPVKSQLCASHGLTPSATLSMNYMETEIFGFHNTFKPLISANTVSVTQDGNGDYIDDNTNGNGSNNGDGKNNNGEGEGD